MNVGQYPPHQHHHHCSCQSCNPEVPLKQLSYNLLVLFHNKGFLDRSVGKESTCKEGDMGSIPGLGRSPGEGRSSPCQYSGLKNPIHCIVHGVTKSETQLSDFHFFRNENMKNLDFSGEWTVGFLCESNACNI